MAGCEHLHALHWDKPVTNPAEGPVIGNGDVAAVINFSTSDLTLRLGRQSIVDARYDSLAADCVLTQDEAIRLEREHGFHMSLEDGDGLPKQPQFDKSPPAVVPPMGSPGATALEHAPSPKPAGTVRLFVSGESETPIDATLDIAHAEFSITWELPERTLTATATIDRVTGVLWLSLAASSRGTQVIVQLDKAPDAFDAAMPLPTAFVDDALGNGGQLAGVSQTIPAGCNVDAFTWHVVGLFNADAAHPSGSVTCNAWQVRQHLPIQAGGEPVRIPFVVSDTRVEGADARGAAATTLRSQAAAGFVAAQAGSRRAWDAFWQTSQVELGDEALEAAWYRSLYALACHIHPDRSAPTLIANTPTDDRSPWMGPYTVNMNIQKMFLPSFATGHFEWIDCYAKWLADYTPVFAHHGRLIFGFDAVYADHMVLPFVPPHRAHVSNLHGRCLGMTPWLGQPLWWHWRYTGDEEFLRERSYPWLRSAAMFCSQYLDKYMDESGDLFPSMNLEEPGWTRGLRHNRNCLVDLIMFRRGFEWAIEAARVLDVDADLRGRWQRDLQRIPPLEWGVDDDGRAWVQVDKHSTRGSRADDNTGHLGHGPAMWAAWAMFPGELAVGDERDDDAQSDATLARVVRDLFAQVEGEELRIDFQWVHHWWCGIPLLRAGVPNVFEHVRSIIVKDRFPAGHLRGDWMFLPYRWRIVEDNYLAVIGTIEMLLQSHGGVVRLLPAWPRDRAASFTHLRAQGGFVISLSWAPGTGLVVTIESHLGKPLVLRWSARTQPRIECDAQAIAFDTDNRTIRFDTQPGRTYSLRAPCLPT